MVMYKLQPWIQLNSSVHPEADDSVVLPLARCTCDNSPNSMAVSVTLFDHIAVAAK